MVRKEIAFFRAKLSGQQSIDWTSKSQSYMHKTTSIAKKAVHVSNHIGSAKKWRSRGVIKQQ
jgi:hypothetical protein